MKKILTIVLALGFITAPLFASLTRVAGLGVPSWMIEKDDSLLWFNPARTLDHSEMVWGEWTAAGSGLAPVVDASVAIGSAWGGVTKTVHKKLGIVGGLFVGRPYDGALDAATVGIDAVTTDVTAVPASIFATAMTPLAPTGKYDIVAAYPHKNMDLGLNLSYASNFNSQENLPLAPGVVTGPVVAGTNEDRESLKSSDLGITIGARKENITSIHKYIGPIKTLDATLSINMLKTKNTEERDQYFVSGPLTAARDMIDNKFELDAGMNFDFTARAIKESGKTKRIMYLRYANDNTTNKYTRKEDNNLDGDLVDAVDFDYTQKRKETERTIALGMAMNKQLNKKTLLITGISYTSIKAIENGSTDTDSLVQAVIKQEYNSSTVQTILPLNIAVERIVSKVVTARVGFDKDIINKTTTKIDNPDYVIGVPPIAWVDDFEDNSSETVVDGVAAAATVTLGVGIKAMKDLDIDFLTRQTLMFTGTYLISGVPETLATQITAKLKF